MKRFDKNHADFDGITFVIKAAVKKDKTKPILHHVLITEDDTLVCTDDHRCHKYESSEFLELPKGLYQIIKATKSEIILAPAFEEACMFPDYRRVFPVAGETVSLEGPNRDGLIVRFSESIAIAVIIRSMGANSVDIDYLRSALTGLVMDKVQLSDGLQPVLLTGCRRSAVIMPVKMLSK